MDKIYSRKRIKIPKIKILYKSNERIAKIYRIFTMLIITGLTVYTILKSVNPIFDNLCAEKAAMIGTDIINVKSTEVLKKYEYKDIVTITKNNTNSANVLKTDVTVINEIASDIAIEVNNSLNDMKNKQIEIPIGVFTGSKYFAGSGPLLKMSIIPVGEVKTDLRTEFKAQGINQTIYRVYLEVVCNVNILTQYKTIEKEITNQVLLVETIIVGDVPTTYYNLEGINEEQTIDLIE